MPAKNITVGRVNRQLPTDNLPSSQHPYGSCFVQESTQLVWLNILLAHLLQTIFRFHWEHVWSIGPKSPQANHISQIRQEKAQAQWNRENFVFMEFIRIFNEERALKREDSDGQNGLDALGKCGRVWKEQVGLQRSAYRRDLVVISDQFDSRFGSWDLNRWTIRKQTTISRPTLHRCERNQPLFARSSCRLGIFDSRPEPIGCQTVGKTP